MNGRVQVLKQRAQGRLGGILGLNSSLWGPAVLCPVLLAAPAWLAPQLGTMTWCLLHPQGVPRPSVRMGWGGVSQHGGSFTRYEHVRLFRDPLPGVADSVSPAEPWGLRTLGSEESNTELPRFQEMESPELGTCPTPALQGPGTATVTRLR